jgi:hypothetical protein
MRLFVGVAIAFSLLSYAPAKACRSPVDPAAARSQKLRQHQESAEKADVIVRARLWDGSNNCLASRHCGEWLEALEVRKGSPANYYLLDPELILGSCSREYVEPGKIGTFHLISNGKGMYLVIDDIKE